MSLIVDAEVVASDGKRENKSAGDSQYGKRFDPAGKTGRCRKNPTAPIVAQLGVASIRVFRWVSTGKTG